MDDAKIAHNLKLVEAHFDSEAAAHIERCLETYTDDIVWEAPARNVVYRGKEAVAAYYLRLWDSMDDVSTVNNDRYATEDRVFDDLTATFTLVGDGFENAPFPVGTRVRLRLLHNFEIRDGLIAKEIGYEIWSEIKDGDVVPGHGAPVEQPAQA
jgi:ketosteroid isomerase-like protein